MSGKRRDVFAELVEGVEAMRGHREGKLTLRTHRPELPDLPRIDGRLVRATRKKLHMSQRVFALTLRINPRTLERWEQGRSTPNEQAAVLILLVNKYPDTIEKISRIGGK